MRDPFGVTHALKNQSCESTHYVKGNVQVQPIQIIILVKI